MKRIMLAAALVSLAVPRIASAEEETDHPWSIGAGVGFSSVSSLEAGAAPFFVTAAPVTPVFTVERLVAPSTSILLGLTAFGSTRKASFVGESLPSGSWSRGGSLFDVGASFGVLRELTSADAPVHFSVIGSVFGGYARRTQEITTVDAPGLQRTDTTYGRGFRGGVEGAIALDKPLLDRLTLRLAATLLSADYAWSKNGTFTSMTSWPSDESSGFDVRLSIDPSLELRFSF